MIFTTDIQMFGKPCRVACDKKCEKAWGIHNRPKVQITDDPDDYAFLADHELETAPDDPSEYEDGHVKPMHPERHNKWCARECERSVVLKLDEPIRIPDFNQRHYNKRQQP